MSLPPPPPPPPPSGGWYPPPQDGSGQPPHRQTPPPPPPPTGGWSGQPGAPGQPWGQPGQAWPAARENHPRAIPALALGCIALFGGFICAVPFLLGPVAVFFGASARRGIAQEPQRWAGATEALIGLVLGVIATVIAVVALIIVVAVIGLATTGSA